MKASYRISRLLQQAGTALFGIGVLLVPRALLAQGCALCYTQAAGSNQRFIQALRSGILILMLPPMMLFIMFAVMAYRRRNVCYGDGSGDVELPEVFLNGRSSG